MSNTGHPNIYHCPNRTTKPYRVLVWRGGTRHFVGYFAHLNDAIAARDAVVPDRRPDNPLTLAELSERTGVTERTIRKWIMLGLVPHAAGRGGGAAHQGTGWYSQCHIDRIQFVKSMKASRYRLAEIKHLLDEA